MENCPNCNSELKYVSCHEYMLSGKQRVGFNFIDNPEDVRENERLAQLCPKCEWNTMGLPKGFSQHQ